MSRYPASTLAPSESARKRARHTARTSLAHSTPRMLCVNTHYPSDPSRAKCPSRSAFLTNFGGSQHRPLEIASSTRFSGQQTHQPEFSTHFRALSSATIGSMRCSSHSSNRVLFLPRCCPCDLDHRNPFSCPGLLSFSKELSLWVFHVASLPCSFLCSNRTILPIFSFNTFVDRPTKGMPISVYQGRTPSLTCNVIDIDTQLLGTHFLRSERQFLGTFPD